MQVLWQGAIEPVAEQAVKPCFICACWIGYGKANEQQRRRHKIQPSSGISDADARAKQLSAGAPHAEYLAQFKESAIENDQSLRKTKVEQILFKTTIPYVCS